LSSSCCLLAIFCCWSKIWANPRDCIDMYVSSSVT
jgi:hypothetical protein